MVTKEFIKEHEAYLIYIYKKKNTSLTREDIQDLVQDTFEKVTLYQDYFDSSKGTLRGWLSMMTVHVYDRFKRGALVIDEIAKDYTQDDMLESMSNYFYTSNKEEVDLYINMLPNQQRDVVYFKLVLGHTHDEIAYKLKFSVVNARTLYTRGLSNLKKLINSDDPKSEVLTEPKILRPHGDKPYAGDWAWRYGETESQRNGESYTYTNEEVIAYCNAHNVNYNLKENIL